MTTADILNTLKKSGKTVCLGRLYVYLKRLDIRPAGANQRPQQYPADSAEKILRHLGLDGGTANGFASSSVASNHRHSPNAAKIMTLQQLKNRKAQKK